MDELDKLVKEEHHNWQLWKESKKSGEWNPEFMSNIIKIVDLRSEQLEMKKRILEDKLKKYIN